MPDMSQMLQAIIGLGQLQVQKREQTLRERSFEENKAQFAQQFGIQQGDQKFREVSKLLDAITNSHAEGRDALVKLGGALGLDQQTTDQLANFAHNAPLTTQMLQTIAANQGYQGASPGNRQMMDANAASATTTGMNQGQLANSGIQAAALGGGQAQFTPQQVGAMQNAAAVHGATGQDQLSYGVGQQILGNPRLLGQMAGVQAGAAVPAVNAAEIGAQIRGQNTQAQTATRGQDIEAQLGMYGHNLQLMDMAGRLGLQAYSARAGNMVTPADKLKALSEMAAINKSSQDLKTGMQENNATTLWNMHVMTAFPELAVPVSQGGLLIQSKDDFKTPGLLDRATAVVSHSMSIPQQQPAFNNALVPQGPQGPQGIQPSPLGTSPQFDIMQFMSQLPGYRPPQ